MYPALCDRYTYLDGAADTQVPRSVIEAVAAARRPESAKSAARSRRATGRTGSSPSAGVRVRPHPAAGRLRGGVCSIAALVSKTNSN